MSVLDEVKAERERQDAQWGGPGHDDEHGFSTWQVFVTGHLRKFEQALGKAFEAEWPNERGTPIPQPVLDELRHRAINVAALMVALVESNDRVYQNTAFRGQPTEGGSE